MRQRVRVTGSVRQPVSIPFRKGMTVLDLVLEAGGPDEFASSNKAKLYRNTPEGTKIYPVYLGDILKKGDLKTNYPLQPADMVSVPERPVLELSAHGGTHLAGAAARVFPSGNSR